MSDLKNKINRFKAVLKDFDKLEKSVQVKLMDVADRLAPKVQGGDIAPKAIRVPEPIEYPDIKETVVPATGVKKHQLEQFADQFLKSDWHPVAKTQKNPSTTVPYEEKPTYRDYIKAPDNLSPHMKEVRDHGVQKTQMAKDGTTFGGQPTGTTTLGSIIGFPKSEEKPQPLGKAAINGARPVTSAIKPPAHNVPDEPSKKK